MDENSVVILPHPGVERTPKPKRTETVVPWPKDGPHRRKYLRTKGTWQSSAGGDSQIGDLEVWCEYEPTTTAERAENGHVSGRPEFIHKFVDPPSGGSLNTDPWVFVPGFAWSVCRRKQLRQELSRGDIVLFGSVVDRGWVLDTVMVICGMLAGCGDELGDSYHNLVQPTLGSTGVQPYIGVPPSRGTPFSFVPARVAGEGKGTFARPSISRLFDSLEKTGGGPPSPLNSQALVRCAAPGGVQKFWEALVEYVVGECKLVLGTSLVAPAKAKNVSSGTCGPSKCKSNGPRGGGCA